VISLKSARFPRLSKYTPRQPAEDIIAAARVVLAVCSQIAIWLDPSTPTKYAEATYALLAGYAVLAIVVAFIVWRTHPLPAGIGTATHVVDLLIFSVLLFLTEGPTSPFFLYFVFSMMTATIRWGWRGSLITAAVVIPVFLGLGAYGALWLKDPTFEVNRFIVRTVYMCVAAGLLAYLGAHEERFRTRLIELAGWSRRLPRKLVPAIGASLARAVADLGAERAILLWTEHTSRGSRMAEWSDGELRTWDAPGMDPYSWVSPQLIDDDFLSWDAQAHDARVLVAAPIAPQERRGTPIPLDLAKRFAMRSVLALNISGEFVRGRLFLLEVDPLTPDTLTLGAIVGRQIGDSLDDALHARENEATTATTALTRIARDLHDGVCQSLTGAELRLTRIELLWDADSNTARRELLDVRRYLSDEQRSLRFFIAGLRSSPMWLDDTVQSLPAYLEDLSRRAQAVWGVQVNVNLQPPERELPAKLAREIAAVVQEAITNSARHGGASIINVTLGGTDDLIRFVIIDDGRGFPFKGFYTYDDLVARRMGPLTLKERLHALGGTVSIDSRETGAELIIEIPLQSQPT
jgi:signal transduction histidine kinase